MNNNLIVNYNNIFFKYTKYHNHRKTPKLTNKQTIVLPKTQYNFFSISFLFFWLYLVARCRFIQTF